jgi:glycerophosphoryl diester phosphodiesterase
MTTIGRTAFFVFALTACGSASAGPPEVVPLPNAHAHNDYLHTRPLFDALDHGFTSVEADVSPVDGSLLVGHEPSSLKPERTLEALYLVPLADRVQKNGGQVFPNSKRFYLLIDFKGDSQETYRLLEPLLKKYSHMLTVVENGTLKPGAVTVVLTGNRPKLDPADVAPRYASLDGRLSDIDSKSPTTLMPMISDAWSANFHWQGVGQMPASDRAKLRDYVKRAHAGGRVIRFWAAPENEEVWREMRAAGADLINTDQLDRLATFLNTPETPKQP